MYPEYAIPAWWKQQRAAAAAQQQRETTAAESVSTSEFWALVMPEMFGEVELDLASTRLVPSLDGALDSRPWHFVRSAIQRLPDIDGTWVQKAVRDVVRRRLDPVPHPHRRGAGGSEGPP